MNEHGFEARSIICVDWGLHTQLHALAPKKLRRRMQNPWPTFKKLEEKNQKEQTATLNYFFPEGKTFVLTFAASKETFPETRRNFLASLIAHPELKSQLVKEFWFGGEKIYELYAVVRLPHCCYRPITNRWNMQAASSPAKYARITSSPITSAVGGVG
jgi:hypothetical protein